MAVAEKTALSGLVTNVAETQAPPGTLIEAENVVVRRPGCIEPRDGLQLAGTLASGFAAYGFSWRTKDFILRNNGSNVFDWRDTAGGTYQYTDLSISTGSQVVDPQPFRRDIFSRAEARAGLYLPYDAGVLKMETDAGPWTMAGRPCLVTVSSNATWAATGTWLANNEQVAYRACVMRTDANGVIVRSVMSGAWVLANTSGVAHAPQVLVTVTLVKPFDFVELYRTRNFPTSVTVDDEMQLVATLPASAFTGGPPPTYLLDDQVLPANRGAVMYTSPSRGGIDEQNDRPPACALTALFRKSLFFANVRGPRKIKVSGNIPAQTDPAVDRSGSATGIGYRTYNGTTTNGSNQLTAMASTVGLEKGMSIVHANIPTEAIITNISGATITMSHNAVASGAGVPIRFYDAIKLSNTSGAVWVKAPSMPLNALVQVPHIWQVTSLNPPESGYQTTYVIEKILRSTAAETIQATHGSEYNPPLPSYDGTPLAISQDAWPGGYMWSKPDEPEHVRPIDRDIAGDQNKAILALIPTRDALYLVKEDGVFRVTGANGDWREDPLDPTARCVLPSSAHALRGRGVFLGDRGVAMVSDEGVELVSAAINDQVKPLIDQILANWLSTGFYELSGMAGAHVSSVFERESEYTLARSSTSAPLVYNDITGAWTTLAYYGHANESLSYKALFNFERLGYGVLSLGVSYYKTILSTEAGADYLRYDRATAVTVNSYAAPNATLSAAINALEDDIIKDSAGRYWRVTAAVNNSATVPVVLGGGTASMATGAGTLYRSLRCSVIATGFTIPLAAQKHWGAFNTAWTKLVGVARLRYGWESSEKPGFNEQNAYTSLAQPALAGGTGVTNYTLGLAPPARVNTDNARAWLLRARIRWAMAHGDAQLEGISADLVALPPGAKQQVAA